MSGLVLKLGPEERLLLNGAVVENGRQRCCLRILTPNANILRLKDAIHPSDANTPVASACYKAQLLLCGEPDAYEIRGRLEEELENLSVVFDGVDTGAALQDAYRNLQASNYYSLLKCLKTMLPLERRLLGKVS